MDQIHLPPELYRDAQSSRFEAWIDRLRSLMGLLWGGRKSRNKDPDLKDRG
jgi:hypothetical protein